MKTKTTLALDLAFPEVEESTQVSALLEGKRLTSSSLQSLALQVASAYRKDPTLKIAIGFPNLFDLQKFSDCLADFGLSSDCFLFPKDEIIRLNGSVASTEMERERLRTLAFLTSEKPGLVLFNSISTIERLVPKETFAKTRIDIAIGEVLDKTDLLSRLTDLGYTRVNWVTNPFEYASRGAVVDVFTPENNLPVRIEFDDDTVDSISLFSPDTETNSVAKDSCVILPCTERPLSEEQAIAGVNLMKQAVIQMKDAGIKGTDFESLQAQLHLAEDEILKTRNIPEGLERYFGYFKVPKTTIFDYLKEFIVYCLTPEIFYESLNALKADERLYLEKLKERYAALPAESIYDEVPPETKRIKTKIVLNSLTSNDGIDEVNATNRSLNESGQLFQSCLGDNLETFAFVDAKAVPTLKDYLDKTAIQHAIYPEHSQGVTIVPQGLSQGFIIKGKKAFLSSREIYGAALKRSRFLSRYKEFRPIKKYSDLNEGDYVVHEDDGIGIYRGLEQRNGVDYLKLEYAKKTTLLVPVFQFSKIRKYAGSEAARPALDTIGGSTWARRKAKIKSRLTFLTDRLLNIYAERAAKPGIAFKPEPELEDPFAAAFQYPLTESQIEAWNAIAQDMEQPHPMDRLIAGDVGFGKTELAFKACFRAIANGYQAAILCPTTVLARQHYEVALERFKDFGVRIASLSRYTDKKTNDTIVSELAEGKVDLVIGTHRLLSQDVKFKKLGFLAVDEEQRFGVAQKERIKEITSKVDVLSLSATPIPRTLQMSLLEIKPMSVLQEPPSNRLPVKTYVVKQDEGLIKEVIARELSRKGQVYFLHNRIEDIYSRAGDIKKMFPDKNIGVAHGRLSPEEMADVMNDFYDGNIDVLVCTSIIESGLDVSNVNTVIVEEAQNFGLSALYQIKGRVGRSDRMAYAYLFYRDYNKLTPEGKERLKALRDFTALGSGYKIAQRDLAIRGAGDILGTEQAGFIDSVGYEAYNELLQEVIKTKAAQAKGLKASLKSHSSRYQLSFTIDARIPDEYAPEADRINLYREFADCDNLEDLYQLRKKVRDAYGPLPREMENLYSKRKIEILLDDKDCFSDFSEAMDEFKITLSTRYSDVHDIAKVTEAILRPLDNHVKQIRFQNRCFVITVRRTADYLSDLSYLTAQIETAFRGKEIEPQEKQETQEEEEND